MTVAEIKEFVMKMNYDDFQMMNYYEFERKMLELIEIIDELEPKENNK